MKALKWNKIDQYIYLIEQCVKRWKKKFEAPVDDEVMITAEMDYLISENEKLKGLQRPGYIICSNNNYYCPHCRAEISPLLLDEYKIKHCPECDKKIVVPIPYPYI